MADFPSPEHPRASQTSGMFQEPRQRERSFPTAAVAVAALAVLVVIGAMIVLGRHKGTTGSPDALQPNAAYAKNLKLSGLAMSESTSFSGGKSTFLDGHITNSGGETVTGITAQVLFAPDGGGAPQLETVPVSLVRTRKPYLDTEPVSAAPLAPGAGADFRLIFEAIRPDWNQQTPEVHLTQVTTR